MSIRQQLLPFGVVRNQGLFSSHWLEHRLELEPDWHELQSAASDALDQLGELWKVQRKRVAKYGDEKGLEEGFIQPVLRVLGWKFKYQARLQGRIPDYALFLDDTALDNALSTDRLEPEFWNTAIVVADAKAWDIDLDRPAKERVAINFPIFRVSVIIVVVVRRSIGRLAWKPICRMWNG